MCQRRNIGNAISASTMGKGLWVDGAQCKGYPKEVSRKWQMTTPSKSLTYELNIPGIYNLDRLAMGARHYTEVTYVLHSSENFGSVSV